MSPTLRSLSPVNPRSDDKLTLQPVRPRSPPYPSPPTDEVKPIDRHLSRESPPPPRAEPVVRAPSPRPSSPKPSSASESSRVIPQALPTPELQNQKQVKEEDEDEEQDEDDIIDRETFEQLLELDEDDPDFSKGMAQEYFEQAETTFTDLDEAFKNKDLPKLSSLGHYLKGSSAALGVTHVQNHCERIQHYGALRDEEANRNLSDSEALALIEKTLVRVKRDYRIAEKWLRDYYRDIEDS